MDGGRIGALPRRLQSAARGAVHLQSRARRGAGGTDRKPPGRMLLDAAAIGDRAEPRGRWRADQGDRPAAAIRSMGSTPNRPGNGRPASKSSGIPRPPISLCSLTRPAMLWESDGEFLLDVLDLHGLPGVQVASGKRVYGGMSQTLRRASGTLGRSIGWDTRRLNRISRTIPRSKRGWKRWSASPSPSC